MAAREVTRLDSGLFFEVKFLKGFQSVKVGNAVQFKAKTQPGPPRLFRNFDTSAVTVIEAPLKLRSFCAKRLAVPFEWIVRTSIQKVQR